MGNLWLKIKVWTKVSAFALLLIYVIVFVAKNSAKTVKPWIWYNHEPETTLLLLVLYVFLAGLLTAVLIGTTIRTIRQVREIQARNRAERLEREVAEMKTKAGMLRAKPDAADRAGSDSTFGTPDVGEHL